MNQSHLLKVSRLEGLTDGVFAIAMTILVLALHLPPQAADASLLGILYQSILFKLFIYIGSFIILGTLWIAMNFQLGLLERLNRPYLWTNVFYLMVVCIVPFSASLIAAFPENPVSLSFFAINLLCAYFGQWLTLHCAGYYHLNRDTYTKEIRKAILNRLYIAPFFYFSAIALAFWNIKIAFLMLVAPPLIYIFPGQVDHFEQ